MKVMFASRTGNIEAFIDRLELEDVERVESGSENVAEDFIIFSYTDGYGEVPAEIDAFLSNNKGFLKGVIASGDSSHGDEVFAKAADVIAEAYDVPNLYKFENDGTDEDVQKVKAILASL